MTHLTEPPATQASTVTVGVGSLAESTGPVLEAVPVRRWAVLDCETTGLIDPRIVEVALVRSDGRVLLDQIVNPGVPIPAAVVAIHGIDDAAVADAPTWATVHPRLLAALEGIDVVYAYNAPFEALCLAAEGTPAAFDLRCAYDASVRALGNVAPPGSGSLASACERAGVAVVPTHRAVDDCLATVALLWSVQPEDLGLLRSLATRLTPRPAATPGER